MKTGWMWTTAGFVLLFLVLMVMGGPELAIMVAGMIIAVLLLSIGLVKQWTEWDI